MPTEKKKHYASVNFRGYFFGSLHFEYRFIPVHYCTQFNNIPCSQQCTSMFPLFIMAYAESIAKVHIWVFSLLKKKLYGFNSNAVTKVHVNVFICTCITGRSLPYRTHTGPTLKLFHCLTQRHENFNQPLSVKTLIQTLYGIYFYLNWYASASKVIQTDDRLQINHIQLTVE